LVPDLAEALRLMQIVKHCRPEQTGIVKKELPKYHVRRDGYCSFILINRNNSIL
jgi:hypothetical protein